jgi:CheY-like chemotaxis protein
VLDLNGVIATLMPDVTEQMGRTIRVVTDLSPDIPAVRADPSQLAAVVSNLAATALEAMPNGGTLTIATDTTVADHQMRTHRPWLTSGPFVRLRIADTGKGIDEQTLPHLFEPFFSAIGPAGAQGLAWSSIYGIVKQSDGFIWADSRIGEGTCVTILLPPAAAEPAAVTTPRRRSRSSNRVLLVDDDEAVREVLAEALEPQGYVVDVAGSAEEALERWAAQPFDLLITDIVLPAIDGRQLAQQIRTMSPHAPVLFMSGYTGDILDPTDLGSSREFLQKPFTSATFRERVRELMHPAAAR